MATDYGKRLKQARKHAKLTQVQLGKKTDISQSTISSAEVGGGGSVETAVYAAACGVNPLWLANGEGDMLAPAAAGAADFSQFARALAAAFDQLPDDLRTRAAVFVKCSELIQGAMRASDAPSSPHAQRAQVASSS